MSGQIQSSTPTSNYQGIAVFQSVCFFMIFVAHGTNGSLLSPSMSPLAHGTVHGQWKHRDDYYTQESALLMQRNPHHEIVFAIKQKNLEKLEEITMQVSDPTSTMYGKHLTHDAVHRMTANPAAAAAVRAWSKQYPALLLKDTSSHDEYMTFDAPLSTWNEILTTKFVKMQHTETGEALIRSPSFTMPAELEQHVAHMFNVVELPLRTGPGVQVRKMPPI